MIKSTLKSKKFLTSALTLTITILAVVASSTSAFFSDIETSTNSVLSSGAINLQIDNTSYYNGELSETTTWEFADLDDGQGPGPEGKYLFFNSSDLKPGDWGEDTISVHVNNNDAWLCMNVDLTGTPENDLIEPEKELDQTSGEDEGELQNYLRFVFWADDGDNVLETDEVDSVFIDNVPIDQIGTVSLVDALNNIWTGSSSDPLSGGEEGPTYYIGKAWCFGALTLAPLSQSNENNPTIDPGIVCEGEFAENDAQTDGVLANMSFMAIQSRHNVEFECADWNPRALDYLDIGNVADETGHDLLSWSDAWVKPGWGGNYGGGSSDTSLRLLMGHGDSCSGSESASFVMHAGAGTATSLTLEHLAGQVNDSFDVYVNGSLVGDYSYNGDPTEIWVTSTFNFAGVTGDIDVELVATNPNYGWCETWGQVAFSSALLE